MFVSPSEKRVEFEKLIKVLGYKDQSPILNNNEKIKYPILKNLSQNNYEIFYFTTPYFNKKTYLYKFFTENYNLYSKNEMLKELNVLCKNILYKEKTRVCEVGWGIDNSQQLYFSTKEHLKKIYLSVIQESKVYFFNGTEYLHPKEGDILVSKPDGGKLLGHNDSKRFLIGREQRAKINYKFGFGMLKEHNSQYARYDKNLIPRPI
jgi:hypothetical protein